MISAIHSWVARPFALDGHVNQNGSVFGWANGDFTFDSRLNGDDYFIIDSNINTQGSPL